MAPSSDDLRRASAQQAADWFVAHRAGPLNAQDARAFVDWLRLSQVNVEEYLATADVTRDMRLATSSRTPLEVLIADAKADISETIPSIAPGSVRRDTRAEQRGVRVVRAWLTPWLAAAMVVMALAVFWSERFNWLSAPMRLATGTAEQTTTLLPDGSTVTLDGTSAVTVRFEFRERLVELARGRAHFAVMHGSTRPFRVVSGPAVITAVGTAFDVDLRSLETIVTVTEGRVRVSAKDMSRARRADSDIVVSSGQRARIRADGIPIIDAAFTLQLADAWREGRLVFDRESLGAVVEEFNRYSRVPIEVVDPAVQNLRISGVFDRNDADSFILSLERLEGVVVERSPARVRLSAAPSSRPEQRRR